MGRNLLKKRVQMFSNLNEKVSIVTACYNSESTISTTIDSVLCQTYSNWEMLIVDDCSTDGSSAIIKQYELKDSRIKYLKTDTSSGSPTLPRNIGIEKALGRYISFLDSDDLWLPTKLENQIEEIKKDKVGIVFSNYEKISELGKRSERIISAPLIVSYKDLLKGNVIGCLTAMYDTQKVGKVYFKNIGHEDYVLWLSILKRGYLACNTGTVEAMYRVRKTSVSSNKFRVLSWQWHIYRKVEKVGLIRSLYYFVNYAIKAICKTLK